jgi:hypothetical protein
LKGLIEIHSLEDGYLEQSLNVALTAGLAITHPL